MSVLSSQSKRKFASILGVSNNKRSLYHRAPYGATELKCVPRASIEEVAALLELSPAQIYDTTFVLWLLSRRGQASRKKRVWVCRSLPCMLRVVISCWRKFARNYTSRREIPPPMASLRLSWQSALGACDGAPCILIEDELQLNVSVDDILAMARKGS